MKILIVNSSVAYDKLFISLGFSVVYELEQADMVCFTGGADVTPSIYNQRRHSKTHNDSMRDDYETLFYKEALEKGLPMVGICRGGQFLHVMNGGQLYQHVDGHATGRPHGVYDVLTGDSHFVTSTHHQMMVDGVGEPVCMAIEANRVEHCSSDDLPHGHDSEVIWHEDTKCLCFQPHPEFNWSIEGAESTYLYFKNLMERYYAN